MKVHFDDFLDSVNSIDEGVRQAEEVRSVYARVGLHIRNWLSNSEEILVRVGQSNTATKKHLRLAR